jgi:hypothetical protein
MIFRSGILYLSKLGIPEATIQLLQNYSDTWVQTFAVTPSGDF